MPDKELLPAEYLLSMKELLSDEYPDFLDSYNWPAVQGFRLNLCKGEAPELERACREYFTLTPVSWTGEGFYYAAGDRPGKHPFHEAGLYYIQEPSAMGAAPLLAVRKGDRVLDLCAAPGGKSTHLASFLQGEGLLVCNEIHPARVKILSQNIERMGIANGVVLNHDTEYLSRRFAGFFDKILVDAPCSGEGMFRKDPAALAQWSRELVQLCRQRQAAVLDHAYLMLKPGGRMVYSTCTFSPEENEQNVAAFLVRHQDMAAVGPAIRYWPHKIRGEGHFFAVLEKRAETAAATAADKPVKSAKPAKPRTGRLDQEQQRLFYDFCRGVLKNAGQKSGREECAGENRAWEKQPGDYQLFGPHLYYVPDGMPALAGLKVLRAGLQLGEFKKNRFEPAHALALYLNKEQVEKHLSWPAGSQEIRRYLGGEALPADPQQQQQLGDYKGWILVCAAGYSIGWGKYAGGVVKNHYPKGLRIH